MESGKVKLEEMQEKSQSSKSNNSTPSSGFSYEADSLSVKLNRDFPRNWFELKRQGILMKYEEMLVQYNNCFVCLQQKFSEVNLLEEENLKLRAENLDLSILISAKEKEIISSIAGPSSGSKAGASSSGANSHLLLAAAKAKLQGGEEKGKGVELLEVYNQGMAKTELCNKWEETGCCPYGERCQFAHGIEELRPVIRHPRYKTEICRMISSGTGTGTGTCPYGHRCHFRHSLDPNEDKAQVLL